MKRATLALCALAGVVTAATLVGCNSTDLAFDLGFAGAAAAGEVRFVDGSPEVAAVTLQETLKRRGLEAVIVKSRNTIVVESKTPGGLRFALILSDKRTADGREQTQIGLEWLDNRSDAKTSVQIFTDLDRQGAKK